MSPLHLTALFASCLLTPPVPGAVLSGFAPIGSYGGHWGVDLAAPPGAPVRAAAAGEVTFAGRVAGMLTVTVHHGGTLRTSYSYLGSLAVSSGQAVRRGDVVGFVGAAHKREGVHWSLRVGDRYLDPMASCRAFTSPGAAVRLTAGTYPQGGAARHPRWHLRPTPLRPPHRR